MKIFEESKTIENRKYTFTLEVNDIVPPEHTMPTGGQGKFKFALLPGHCKTSSGAFSTTLNTYEFPMWEKFCLELKNDIIKLGHEAEIFYRPSPSGQGQVATQVDLYKPNASLEFHFNAYNNQVRGSEIRYSNTHKDSLMFANEILECMYKVFNRSQKEKRGLIWNKDTSDRAFYNTSTIKSCPNCLIEPFFGDNDADCHVYLNNKDAFKKAIIDTLINFAKEMQK